MLTYILTRDITLRVRESNLMSYSCLTRIHKLDTLLRLG
jgi:hypothetical protein